MTTNQVGILLCRIAALFLVVQAIENVAFGMSFAITTGQEYLNLVAVLMMMAPPLIAAAVIWFMAARLSGFDTTAGEEAAPPARDFALLVNAGILLIGLYALLFGIIDLVRVEAGFWAQEYYRPEDIPLTSQELISRWPARASYALKIVFGFLLVVGRDAVAHFFRHLRRAGIGPTQD